MVGVADIRVELSERQNCVYKDYQIERWIDHQGGKKVDVVRTVNEQAVNEHQLRAILDDPVRFECTLHDLNRGVLHIIPVCVPDRVVVYVDMRNKSKVLDPGMEADGLILFMYYLLKHVC